MAQSEVVMGSYIQCHNIQNMPQASYIQEQMN